MSAKTQRLRVTYTRDTAARFISHLDMMRFWERALRRAGVPVSYSEGFTPHAQVALAAPLAVGLTSRCELMDIFLSRRMDPASLHVQLAAQLPPSMAIVGVEEAELSSPSLQSQTRSAEYRFLLGADADLEAVKRRVSVFLAAASVPWELRREKETKRYDLRPLVLELAVSEETGHPAVMALLRAEEGGTARPDQVAEALDISAHLVLVERVKLNLAQRSPVAG
jgi:radical SAM-linked protein